MQTLKTVSFEEIHATNIEQEIAKDIKDVKAIEQKKEIINWEPSPLSDPSKLTNQYLMLSKIRLTSKYAPKSIRMNFNNQWMH